MKALNTIIESGNLLLAAENDLIFAVFNSLENRLIFKQTMPNLDTWAFSKEMGRLAALNWDSRTVWTFDSKDGKELTKTKVKVAFGGGVFLYKNTLRITSHSLIVLDLHGKILTQKRLSGSSSRLVNDLGEIIVTEDERNIHFFDEEGGKLFQLKRQGIGITASTFQNGIIAICESRKDTRIINKSGENIDVIPTPAGYNPVNICLGLKGEIYLVFLKLNDSHDKMFCIYQSNGVLLNQEIVPDCAIIETYSESLSCWIACTLETYSFQDGHLRKGRLEVIREAFGLEL